MCVAWCPRKPNNNMESVMCTRIKILCWLSSVITIRFRRCSVFSSADKVSWTCQIAIQRRRSICPSICLSVKQACFVTMGPIGRMWPFFQLVPLVHLTEPSFGPIRLTAWPPGGGTWKSKQSDISPELSVGLLPYFYLKYMRLTQYIFHPSFWFDPFKGALPPNYSDRQAANRFRISRETFHPSEDSRRTPERMTPSSWRPYFLYLQVSRKPFLNQVRY
jgi:hypothetical protein